MATKKEFGSRLKTAMIAQGLSQKDLAADISITPAMLSNYVTGKNYPPVETLIIISERLSVSADWLLSTGKYEDNWQPEIQLETLGDVMRCLFELDRIMDVSIRDIEIPDDNSVERSTTDDSGAESDGVWLSPQIRIDNVLPRLWHTLDDWKKIKELNLGGDVVKTSLLPAWVTQVTQELDRYDLMGCELPATNDDPTED
ncbi:MAG: helix-turn-helix domain-containing protein [Oscillospiraceae bacterium]|nr:helix-turn-helix domain-containing protein [Oscillospiraceae bacterium]